MEERCWIPPLAPAALLCHVATGWLAGLSFQTYTHAYTFPLSIYVSIDRLHLHIHSSAGPVLVLNLVDRIAREREKIHRIISFC